MTGAAQHNGKKNGRRAGMTLLEVILAIAATAFLLASAASFVVSVSSIWLDRENRHFFHDHVDGVTEFLRGSFAQAGVAVTPASSPSGRDGREDGGEPEDGGDGGEPEDGELLIEISDGGESGAGGGRAAPAPGGALLRTTEDPVDFARPPGFERYRDPLLHFRLARRPPLLVAPDAAPAQFIEVYLYFEPDEGLSLLWTSNLQEEADDLRDLRRTRVSRWVSGLRYVYWDERFDRWEEEDEPLEADDGEPRLPRYLKIEFTHGEEKTERLLALPVPSTALPLF